MKCNFRGKKTFSSVLLFSTITLRLLHNFLLLLRRKNPHDYILLLLFSFLTITFKDKWNKYKILGAGIIYQLCHIKCLREKYTPITHSDFQLSIIRRQPIVRIRKIRTFHSKKIPTRVSCLKMLSFTKMLNRRIP